MMLRVLLAAAGVALIGFQGMAVVAAPVLPSAVCKVRGEVMSVENGVLTARVHERTRHEARAAGQCDKVQAPETATYAIGQEGVTLLPGDRFIGHVHYAGDEFGQGYVIDNIETDAQAAPHEGHKE